MDTPKKRSGYHSKEQKRKLLALMEADRELSSGKFSPTFTHKMAQQRWVKIANVLNAIGPANKSWSEWRKCYQDKKAKTKKKASCIKIRSISTEVMNELDEDEKRMLASVSGHSNTKESKVFIKDDPGSINFICMQEDEIDETNCSEESSNETSELYPKCSKTTENKKDPHLTKVNSKNLLAQSTDAELALQRSLDDELKMKKNFYASFLEQMTRQTDALVSIARSLNARHT